MTPSTTSITNQQPQVSAYTTWMGTSQLRRKREGVSSGSACQNSPRELATTCAPGSPSGWRTNAPRLGATPRSLGVRFTIRPRTAPLNCRGDPNPESPPASKYYIGISPGSESPMAKISPCGPCRKGLEHNCWMTEGPGPAGLNISDLTKTLSPKSSTSALSMRRKLHSAPRSRRAGGNVEWPGADTPGPGEYHTQKLQDRF